MRKDKLKQNTPSEVEESLKKHNQPTFWKKLNRKNYAVITGMIAMVIVGHFIFQYFFIQSENTQMLRDLTKAEEVRKKDTFDKNISEIIEIPVTEYVEEIKPDFTNRAEEEKETERKVTSRKIEPKSRRFFDNAEIRKRTRENSAKTSKKKEVPKETRAERLRRVEKILTGV